MGAKNKIIKPIFCIISMIFFSMTQGCITTESFGSGRGAGAKHKGPWFHEHKTTAKNYSQTQSVPDSSEVYEPIIVSTEIIEDDLSPVDSYIVKKGDILSQIAVDFNTTTLKLKEMNNLSNPNKLYVGQELQVPSTSIIVSTSDEVIYKSDIPKGGSYEIQKGDTLSEIAVSAGVSIDDLRELNNISGDKIFAGQTIDIPAYGKTPDISSDSISSVNLPKASELASLDSVESPNDESSEGTIGRIIEVLIYSGETLDDIALEHGVKKEEIRASNPILEDYEDNNLDDLVGKKLKIPVYMGN